MSRPEPVPTYQPFFSVVVCAFNAEHRLARALKSLLKLDYPTDRYEIIVVDDGSSDNTVEVAASYPVKLIRHQQNAGIAAARNSGLAAASGEVYVCFDDDCLVNPNWLTELAKAYQARPNALGIGSVIAEPKVVDGIVTKFMVAVGSGNPTPLHLGQTKQPARRFMAYLSDQLMPPQQKIGREVFAVRHLNGATASFKIETLKAINGWNSDLRWMEDTDVCSRLASHFTNRQFYAQPTARIIHDPHMPLGKFIKRPYKRGVSNLAYYRQQHTIPPIFPFPLIYPFAVILCLWLRPHHALLVFLVLPFVLYFWWPIRAVAERRLVYLVFPLLQLAEEASTVAGIMRGYLTGTPKHDNPR